MNNSENKIERRFTSKWGFILASVGSAVGMANVWGFPNKLGSNGGGAFLLIYIMFIFLFSYVGLPTEFAVGRWSKTGTLGTYPKAWKGKNEKCGYIVSFIPLMGIMCIAIGYSVIVAYVLKALIDSLNGTIMTANIGNWFEGFALNSYSVVPYHIIVVAGTLITLFMGAKSIEKTNKIMMPTFFVIFLILAIRVAFLPNVIEGYKFMLVPRWEYLKNPMVWISAMGQAFFSLSITGSGMLTYGAYLDDNEDVVNLAANTGLFDTVAAFTAALVIIPACFSYNLDVAAGPGQLFVTLPAILKDIPFGQIFSVILYIAMIFAGVSSMQNMFETVAEAITFKFPKIKRAAALVIIGVICLGFALNMEAISSWGPWMDLVSIYIIPVGALLGAVSWFYIMKKDELLTEVNKGTKRKHGEIWYNMGKFIYVPLALILCLVAVFMKVSF